MATARPTILVIEDEAPIRHFLRLSLESQNYRLLEASTGEEGLKLRANYNPEVILLDLGLPDMDGLKVIELTRESTANPIIILSARGKDEDKIRALELGADDYLIKPFNIRELNARIKVAMRRYTRPGSTALEPVYELGRLKVDLENWKVFLGGKEVHLTPIEFKILAIMVRNAGRLVTQKEILSEIWGPSGGGSAHYLRIYTHQLRQKLEENPAKPRYLITEPRVGYRLKIE